MTGRETSDRELRILEEAGLPEDPALLHAVRDLRALGTGPAPEASAELAQLMADGGKAPQSRRNKRRITFLGGALAVSMGVGMSGVAAGTLHLPYGLGDAVDSIARFSVHHDPDHHDPDRPEPAAPVVAPSIESPAGALAVPVPAPSAIAAVPAVPVAGDPTGPGDVSGAGAGTVTPEVPSIGGRTAPGAPLAMPAVPPVATEKPPVGQVPAAPGTPPVQDLRPATVPGGRVPGTPTGETPPGDGKRKGQVDQGKLQDRNTVQKDGTVQGDGRGQDTQAEGVVTSTGPERGDRDVRRSFAGPDPSWRLTPVEQADEPMFLAGPFSDDDAGMSLFLADADILAYAEADADVEQAAGPANDPSGDAAPDEPATGVEPPAEPVTVVEPTAEPLAVVEPTAEPVTVEPPAVKSPAPVAEDG
ncbi:hypothetical protein [Arthrobacter sp. NPDC092385]|uniref:hypothetical protein n=1 Tax=Arthrobacter sp. NPDC092385 TaxID=3363943 RepID=UPI00382EB1BE